MRVTDYKICLGLVEKGVKRFNSMFGQCNNFFFLHIFSF